MPPTTVLASPLLALVLVPPAPALLEVHGARRAPLLPLEEALQNSDPCDDDARWVPGAAGTNDRFGISVALDGDTALVGARQRAGTGAAYVLRRSRTT